MKTDNKQLEISEEIAITEPCVIKIIKELCPKGAAYAECVGKLAYDLCESVSGFCTGVLAQDYGWYPFLIVKEVHYEEPCVFDDPIVLKSKFNMDSFNDWMDCLSISSKTRDMIKGEVRVYYDHYHPSDRDNLDMVYLDVMKHLIQSFKCLQRTYDNARNEINKVYQAPVGMHCHVSLTCTLTLPYLMKKVKRFNRNKGAASGKYLLVAKTDSEDRVTVICQKYNKKLITA